MERRNKLAATGRPGSVEKTSKDLSSRHNLAELILRYGQIILGVLRPFDCVAVAHDGQNSLALLVRRDGESLPQLLQRLDLAVGQALSSNIYTDEVNHSHSK